MQLLERERCLDDLAEWLAGATKHGGCVALVGGEAGVGKTSLLEKFAKQRADTGDARVLWGACDALLTPRPLAPLHDIARQTQGALLAAVNSATSRDVIFSAALDELDRTPSFVVFEDVHWADAATLDLLKFLGRRIQRMRAMLVATYRDDEVGPNHPLRFAIGDLPRASTRRMLLAPLSESAVVGLANQAGRSSQGLHALTGGNPLFVTELLASSGERMPTTVSDAVLARVGKLTPPAREIAELVCIVPGRTEDWLLRHAVQADEASIESCLAAGMVRHEDGALAFRHELMRRALEDSLTPLRQQNLHARVLAALIERGGVSAARLAHHADGARNAEAVLRYAPAAAEQASSVAAHREAAASCEVALRYAARLAPAQRADLLEKLSFAYYMTDHIERAVDARREALAIWRNSSEPLKEGLALSWLSRFTWFAGRRAESERCADEAIETLEPLPPGPELAMAYSNYAELAMLAHKTDSAIEWAQRAIALVQRLGSDATADEILSHALNSLGAARVNAGDSAGWADLEHSLQLALKHGLQEQVARAYISLGWGFLKMRRYSLALRWLADGLAYSDERDLDAWRLYLLATRARARFDQGDWQDAGDDATAVVQHHGTAPFARAASLVVIGHLRVRRGDPDASSPLDKARALAATMPERIGPLAVALADAAWLAGDRETVIREVKPVYEFARERRDPWMKGELAAWLWRAGALDQPPADIAEPYALEMSGDWLGAARAWHALGCPYEQASMLAWYGTASEQREALAIFERLGANPAAQSLRKQLRARGVRGIPRGARPFTRSNEYGLTKREAEILQLLSQGLRNSAIAKRLQLSIKTVERHVSAILMKLGVSSRAQAIAMMLKPVSDTHRDPGSGPR
jgi:DNA-binding CsgD family transcriptional regulator